MIKGLRKFQQLPMLRSRDTARAPKCSASETTPCTLIQGRSPVCRIASTCSTCRKVTRLCVAVWCLNAARHYVLHKGTHLHLFCVRVCVCVCARVCVFSLCSSFPLTSSPRKEDAVLFDRGLCGGPRPRALGPCGGQRVETVHLRKHGLLR